MANGAKDTSQIYKSYTTNSNGNWRKVYLFNPKVTALMFEVDKGRYIEKSAAKRISFDI